MTTLFSSKWDAENEGNIYSGYANQEDDGGNWVGCRGDIEYWPGAHIERVSGDQSAIGRGGPSAPPPAPNTTYYVRCYMPNNGAYGAYMVPVNDWHDHQGGLYPDSLLRDLYQGVWAYFETGFDFEDSIKFLDFRTHHQATGNGHYVLYGFAYDCRGCTDKGTGADNNANQDIPADNAVLRRPTGSDWPHNHNLGSMKYKYSATEDTHEYHWNWWNAAQHDQNMASGLAVSSEDYTINTPTDRILASGGVWMAFIVHAKIHATDGVLEAWIKKGTGALTKVMEWNRNTVWDTPNIPHDFYTINNNGDGYIGIDSVGLNQTHNAMNSNQYVWLSNYIVATTYDEVAAYLGLDEEGSASLSPNQLRIKNITRPQNFRKIHPKY